MKRKIATRKLKRPCLFCNCNFNKGNVYYKVRRVFTEDAKVHAYEYLLCARCKYRQDAHNKAYSEFLKAKRCKHPQHLREETYTPIAGEPYVKEPSYTVCGVCSEVVV